MSSTRDDPNKVPFSPANSRMWRGMSAREWAGRVWRGLRSPRDSGKYRFARREIKRLLAPLCACVVPFLAALLLVLLASARTAPPPQPVPVRLAPADPELPLDPPPVDPEPEPRRMDPQAAIPDDLAISEPVVVDVPRVFETPPLAAPVLPTLSPIQARMPIAISGLALQRNIGKREALNRFNADARTEDAVLRALRWLKSRQEPDGSWREPKAAMTGLALLTFLAHNERPDSEEFGATVQGAIEWLMDNQESDGHFRHRDEHDYSHPIATYALCEAYGLTSIPMIRDVAEKAVGRIVAGQHLTGGWDYNLKQTTRNDISYSGWCVQALKAAHIAGVEHDGLESALDRAVAGIKRNAAPEGGFGYTEPGRGALTGVGVLSLQLLHRHRDGAARRGLVRLAEIARCEWEEPDIVRPLYNWYYTTQAFFHAGKGHWSAWNRQFSSALIENQIVVEGAGEDGRDIGYWEAPGGREQYGLVYNTTLCALMLQVYYRYLPTFAAPADPVEESDGGFYDEDIVVTVIDNPAPIWPYGNPL